MPDPMIIYLEFEKAVAELEAKVNELRTLAAGGSDIGDEISKIEEKSAQALAELYANLTPWQKTQVARHPDRPELAIGYVAAPRAAQLPGLARKLPHYHKYSYLAFEGDEPTNVAKALG